MRRTTSGSTNRTPAKSVPGQVLVKVGMGGICGSDLHYFHNGGFGTVRIKEPMVLGHEVAGTVVAVAPGVQSVRIGDKVAINPSRPCGACKFCLEGLPNQCLDMRFYGSAMRTPHVQGAFRNMLLCEATQCVKVADHVPLRLARWPSRSRWGCTACRAPARCWASACWCRAAGPSACWRSRRRARTARPRSPPPTWSTSRWPSHAPWAPTRSSTSRRTRTWVSRYSPDKGTFDVMLECSGNERALRDGLEVMRPRGVVVQLGLGGDVSIPQNMVVAKELSICGSFRFHAEFALAVRLINEGRVDLSPVVSHTFPMLKAREAFELASDRRRR
jgi:L-idonate 5-dehydrogenase